MGRMTVPDDVLDQMRGSDRVTVRHLGVVAAWLRRMRDEPDEIKAAKNLLVELTGAGLATFIRADLDDFIEHIKKRRNP
jgi:hypothetical protein